MPTGFHEVRFPLRLALGRAAGRSGAPILSAFRTGARTATGAGATRAGTMMRARGSSRSAISMRCSNSSRRGQGSFTGSGSAIRWISSPVDRVERLPPMIRWIGTGDGEMAVFQLAKTYGDAGGVTVREIVKPVTGTVAISIGGVLSLPPILRSTRRQGVSRSCRRQSRRAALLLKQASNSMFRCVSIRTASTSIWRSFRPGAFRLFPWWRSSRSRSKISAHRRRSVIRVRQRGRRLPSGCRHRRCSGLEIEDFGAPGRGKATSGHAGRDVPLLRQPRARALRGRRSPGVRRAWADGRRARADRVSEMRV